MGTIEAIGGQLLHHGVERASQAIQGCSDQDGVLAAFLGSVGEFGFNSVAIGHLVNPAIVNLESPKWFNVSSWPAEWWDTWKDLQLIVHDPIAQQARRSSRPFAWDEAYQRAGPKGREVLDRAGEFGFKDGLAIPIHDVGRPTGIVTLGGDRTDLSPEQQRAVLTIAIFAYSRLEEFLGPLAPEATPELTEREREILTWIAAGKGDWEISTILLISQHTVRTHFRAAAAKLGATSRAMACVRAASRGLILGT